MKKLTTIILLCLLTLALTFGLVACGDKCEQHVYDDCADIECNVCGDKRDSMHTWIEANCTTAKTCSVCGATEGSALGHTWIEADCENAKTCSVCEVTDGNALGHKPAEDDDDCSTEVKCTICGDVTTPAGQHTPNADDGDCTTPITCSVCGTVTTEAKQAHTPNADDGDCTTAVTCQNCSVVITPAKDAHNPNADDGNCLTAITCSDCGTVTTEAKQAHTPNADDGNCLTAIACSVCGTTTTPANDNHTGGTATCVSGKICEICGVEYDTAKNPNNHVSTEFTYTNNGDGTHQKLYACCEVVHTANDGCSFEYTDNGDGTHDKVCSECGYVEMDNEKHTAAPDSYDCICGATVIAVIDGTLGGKATAAEEDITALVDQLKAYVDKGITTIIVTGAEPAMIDMGSWINTAIGEAIYRLPKDDSYNGKIDLILPDVTEIVDQEFYDAHALNSINLPKVTTVGDGAFYDCQYLQELTFGSVVTAINHNTSVEFHRVGEKVEGCNLVLNAEQVNAATEYQPNVETKTWWNTEWKSITLK